MNVVLSESKIAELSTAANNYLKGLLTEAEEYATKAETIHNEFQDLLNQGISIT